MAGSIAYPTLNVLFIAEVEVLSEPDVLLHGNAVVCDTSHLLLAELVGMGIFEIDLELSQPHILDVLAIISNDVIEDEIEEHKQLDAHLLEDGGAHDEQFELFVFGW